MKNNCIFLRIHYTFLFTREIFDAIIPLAHMQTLSFLSVHRCLYLTNKFSQRGIKSMISSLFEQLYGLGPLHTRD